MKCEVVTTRDGASAIRDALTGEVMHPVVGPLVESKRIYLEPSNLEAKLRDATSFTLFDVGLGAGSNAIAAWSLAESIGAPLSIVSFDRSLAAMTLALDHPTAFGFDGAAGVAARAIVEHAHHEAAHASWRYVDGDLPASLSHGPADMVWWDPFSPRSNPTLWTVAAFSELRRHCAERCIVHTYSGATATRSALLLAGFAVGVGIEVGPGTGGPKRATVAAMRVDDLAEPLDRRWLERLQRSSAGLPTDAPQDALERIASLPQLTR